MNRNANVVLAIAALAAAGCEEKVERPQRRPALAAAPAHVVTHLEPRYDASLAEGIDFRRPGYPGFLTEVSGMSGHESQGRWTDADMGPEARFRFKDPLPNSFTLEIEANAFGPNVGRPVRVRVGSVEKSFVVRDVTKPEVYKLSFATSGPVDTIEIVPPLPTSPASMGGKDQRRLGVILGSLKIR